MNTLSVTKSEFYFPSADGKTTNHGILWMPEQEPTAVLQIVHGVTEYIDRYDAIAGYFVRKGFAVAGMICSDTVSQFLLPYHACISDRQAAGITLSETFFPAVHTSDSNFGLHCLILFLDFPSAPFLSVIF